MRVQADLLEESRVHPEMPKGMTSKRRSMGKTREVIREDAICLTDRRVGLPKVGCTCELCSADFNYFAFAPRLRNGKSLFAQALKVHLDCLAD